MKKTGANVVLKALEAPLFHIAANAGLEGSVIINKVSESEPGVGFNALTEEYVDMVEAGILDPAKSNKKCTSERNKCSIYASDNRVLCSEHQKKILGNASRHGAGMGMM